MYTTSTSCPGCPYAGYQKFYNYYGTHGWADVFVSGALASTAVSFPSTPSAEYTKDADFSTYTTANSRTQAVKKGTAYMNVWMYVIREFEDAIDDCSIGALDNNYGSVHAWDEGVAFYAGSLEGTDGSGSGKQVYALADKRCENFNTCGADGTASTGTSKVNIDLLELFRKGRNYLLVLDCAAATAWVVVAFFAGPWPARAPGARHTCGPARHAVSCARLVIPGASDRHRDRADHDDPAHPGHPPLRLQE